MTQSEFDRIRVGSIIRVAHYQDPTDVETVTVTSKPGGQFGSDFVGTDEEGFESSYHFPTFKLIEVVS